MGPQGNPCQNVLCHVGKEFPGEGEKTERKRKALSEFPLSRFSNFFPVRPIISSCPEIASSVLKEEKRGEKKNKPKKQQGCASLKMQLIPKCYFTMLLTEEERERRKAMRFWSTGRGGSSNPSSRLGVAAGLLSRPCSAGPASGPSLGVLEGLFPPSPSFLGRLLESSTVAPRAASLKQVGQPGSSGGICK